MHRLNAATFLGIAPEQVTEAQRNAAKGVASFGVLYGSGPAGLVASAWSRYRITMTEAEARAHKDAFYARYPALREWQSWTADAARATGVLRSVAGRPLRAEWEGGELRWTLCCNYPVQSSAADVMQLAMAKVHAALAGLDARLILQIHDELVIEAAADVAPEVERLLTEHMTAAYLELFPDAPTRKLVDVATRPCWAKPPKDGAEESAAASVDPSPPFYAPAAPTPRYTAPPRAFSRPVAGPPVKTVEVLLTYIRARAAIRQRRDAGQAWPWTSDAVLRDHRFCEVRPEDDRVSRWLQREWYGPFADHPSLPLAAVLARLINNPVVLGTLGFPERWDPAHARAVLQDLKDRKVPIWTLSYTAVFRGAACARTICSRSWIGLPPIRRAWRARKASKAPPGYSRRIPASATSLAI